MNKTLLALCLLSSPLLAAPIDPSSPESLVGQYADPRTGEIGDYGRCADCSHDGPLADQTLWAMRTYPDGSEPYRTGIFLFRAQDLLLLGAVSVPGDSKSGLIISLNCQSSGTPKQHLVAVGTKGIDAAGSMFLSKVENAWVVSQGGGFQRVDPKGVLCADAVEP